MPCEGSVRRWRCGICEDRDSGVDDQPPVGWHLFGGECYCPACWRLLWPWVRSIWYKIADAREQMTRAIQERWPSEEKYRFRHSPKSVASDILRDAVRQLHDKAYLHVDGDTRDLQDEDALNRHYGDGPSEKEA